jgi:purine-nucleoside phosphorylase
MFEQIESTTRSIRERIGSFTPVCGIILGSGLSALASEIAADFSIPYGDIPGFAQSTVKGHNGRLIFGTLSGKKVVAMEGRFHAYEGYTMQQITLPVRIMKSLGVQTLIVSNASGGMNPAFKIGEIMIIADHINLFSSNPLIGANDERLGPRFLDMGHAYSPRLRELAKKVAAENDIRVTEGVYAGLSGPCFETPAEYRYLWRMGADAVGMSTVPEVIVARHAGLEVFGISIISDLGVEGHVDKVSHEEVLKVASQQEPKVSRIVTALIGAL